MPVKIPDDLPAAEILRRENISVIPQRDAFAQDIRALRVAIVNIMPLKHVTETQLLRLLGNSPLQVAITLLYPNSHASRNTPPDHLARFYKTFEDVKHERFDCLIITGAPVETLPFSDVTYWDELQLIMNWSLTHVFSTLHICWGAQAGLYQHFGIEKHPLTKKISGIFQHKVLQRQIPLFHGFDDCFPVPHSRHTKTRREDIVGTPGLDIWAESEEAGVCIIGTQNTRQIFITGHPEYDPYTLRDEYKRDLEKGLQCAVPENYFPHNNPSLAPPMTWRAHANLLFSNWLNLVYAATPFDLKDLQPCT